MPKQVPIHRVSTPDPGVLVPEALVPSWAEYNAFREALTAAQRESVAMRPVLEMCAGIDFARDNPLVGHDVPREGDPTIG